MNRKLDVQLEIKKRKRHRKFYALFGFILIRYLNTISPWQINSVWWWNRLKKRHLIRYSKQSVDGVFSVSRAASTHIERERSIQTSTVRQTRHNCSIHSRRKSLTVCKWKRNNDQARSKTSFPHFTKTLRFLKDKMVFF